MASSTSGQRCRAIHGQCADVPRPEHASVFLKGLEADLIAGVSQCFVSVTLEFEIALAYRAHQPACENGLRSPANRAQFSYAPKHRVRFSRR
jgi:hypothetical protein